MIFSSARQLQKLIGNYFAHTAGEWHMASVPLKGKAADDTSLQKIWDREPEPPTLSGLALYLGFESLDNFEAYEREGEYAAILKRGRLQVEAEYEKKLHGQSAGIIFALKKLGWTDKGDNSQPSAQTHLEIKLIESGPQPVGTEKDVQL